MINGVRILQASIEGQHVGLSVVNYAERLRGEGRVDNFTVALSNVMWICVGGMQLTIRCEFLGVRGTSGRQIVRVDHCRSLFKRYVRMQE